MIDKIHSFQLSGIAILALGIWTKVDLHVYVELSTVYYKEAPYILIGVGAVIVLVGSLGCCCTFKGKSVLLYLVSLKHFSLFFQRLFQMMRILISRRVIYSNFIEQGNESSGNHKILRKLIDLKQISVQSCSRRCLLKNCPFYKPKKHDL